MVIIFYDANKEQVYICTESDKTRIISVNDPNLMNFIPNDDILYVSNAHFITKAQFKQWLDGDFEFEPQNNEQDVSRITGMFAEHGDIHAKPAVNNNKRYIHPTHNGSIRIEDIQTPQFPDGIQLNGKWHFIAVDAIGEDLLTESNHFKVLLAKGKIELVPESYVVANKHKLQKKKSPYQAALDAILVPTHIKAEAAASGDWDSDHSIATEIMIEG